MEDYRMMLRAKDATPWKTVLGIIKAETTDIHDTPIKFKEESIDIFFKVYREDLCIGHKISIDPTSLQEYGLAEEEYVLSVPMGDLHSKVKKVEGKQGFILYTVMSEDDKSLYFKHVTSSGDKDDVHARGDVHAIRTNECRNVNDIVTGMDIPDLIGNVKEFRSYMSNIPEGKSTFEFHAYIHGMIIAAKDVCGTITYLASIGFEDDYRRDTFKGRKDMLADEELKEFHQVTISLPSSKAKMFMSIASLAPRLSNATLPSQCKFRFIPDHEIIAVEFPISTIGTYTLTLKHNQSE